MRLKPTILLIILSIAVAQATEAAEAWQVTIYEKAQALFLALDKKEEEILTRYEPKVAAFYAVFAPMKDAEWKMRRYVFCKRLKENPGSIDWTHWLSWTGGGIGTKEEEKLAAEDPAYMALRQDFLAKKEVWKRSRELTRMRNAVYEQHSAELVESEENLLKDLKVLQAEVDRRMQDPGSDGRGKAAPVTDGQLGLKETQ